MRFGESVTEAKNEFRGTIPFSGHGTEQKFKFDGSMAEAWRNGPPRWTRNVIKFEVWRKRGGSVADWPSSVDTQREGLAEAW